MDRSGSEWVVVGRGGPDGSGWVGLGRSGSEWDVVGRGGS